MPQLTVTTPETEPRTLELSDTMVVGRVSPADLVVADAKVSRRHCKVSKSRSGWTVTDLGSSNGTRIAGRVVRAHVLRDGDRVEIGRTVLTFHADPERAPTAPARRSARDRLSSRRRR